MSVYDNDDRVRKVEEGHYSVSASGNRYFVYAETTSEWYSMLSIDRGTPRTAAAGPFVSADEALRELIGDPR